MAFARHFFAQVNKAYTTPQAGLIAPLSTPNCKSCAGYEERARGLEASKERYDRLPLAILEVSPAPDRVDGLTLIDVVFRQTDARLIDSAGHELSRFTTKSGIFVLHVRWSSGLWVANEIQVRQP
ncbi:MAG: hypothetical protein WBC31_01235 [Candidatus Phosphoribacter baldrii]